MIYEDWRFYLSRARKKTLGLGVAERYIVPE
jgi:hypothetical protein